MTEKYTLRCPLCNGSGKQFHLPHGLPTWTGQTPDQFKVLCHGCLGKGWVVVE